MSLFGHFFKVLSLYLEARIRISASKWKVGSRSEFALTWCGSATLFFCVSVEFADAVSTYVIFRSVRKTVCRTKEASPSSAWLENTVRPERESRRNSRNVRWDRGQRSLKPVFPIRIHWFRTRIQHLGWIPIRIRIGSGSRRSPHKKTCSTSKLFSIFVGHFFLFPGSGFQIRIRIHCVIESGSNPDPKHW